MDLSALVAGADPGPSGVDHGAELLAFTDALLEGSDAELARARAELLTALGPEGLVDAAAVAGNFQRMVRIADATGIPLDPPLALMAGDIGEALDLGRFASAANTPAVGRLARLAGPALRPLARLALRRLGPRLLRKSASHRPAPPH